ECAGSNRVRERDLDVLSRFTRGRRTYAPFSGLVALPAFVRVLARMVIAQRLRDGNHGYRRRGAEVPVGDRAR
ncbi:MAG: hypothetical protein ACYDB8_05415, partial [Acidiferrobacterales bacterium]